MFGCGVWWRAALVSSSPFARPTIGLVPLSPSQPEFYSLPFCILFSFCLFGSGISPVLFGAPSCRSGWCGGAASSVVRGWNPVESLGAEEAPPPLPASAAGAGGAAPLLAQVRIVPLPITLHLVVYGYCWCFLSLRFGIRRPNMVLPIFIRR